MNLNDVNTLCYCRESLTSAGMRPGWPCRSCWRKQTTPRTFYCSNQQCLFRKYTECYYMICPSCYTLENGNNGTEKKMQQNEIRNNFIHSKLTRDLQNIQSATRELNSNSAAVENFADAVVREATVIDSNVDEDSVREAIERGGLSWKVIENERKDIIVGKLRAIAELDQNQCNALFHKLDGMIPIAPDTERQNRFVQMWIIFYQTWIMKLSPEEVGGEEILNNLKRDVGVVFKDALSICRNQICYCKAPLARSTFNRPFKDWSCRSCFTNQTGRVGFYCPNISLNKCIFEQLARSDYVICPQCFEWRDNNQICDETDEKEDGIKPH